MLRCKLFRALNVLMCVYQCFSFLSCNHLLFLWYQFSNHCIRTLELIFHNSKAISFSSLFASSLGLLVIFLITICFWWYWHICVGIFQNPHNSHLLPSHTIQVISTQLACNSRIHTLYCSTVSYFTLYQRRFCCVSGSLKTMYQNFLHRYVVSIITTHLHFGISFFKRRTIKPFLDSFYAYRKLIWELFICSILKIV